MAKSSNRQTNFKNSTQSSYLARDIAKDRNLGSATENKVEVVLNDIRETTGIKSLRFLDNNIVQEYANVLSDKVENGELSSVTTSSYVSILNNIIEYINEHININDRNLETISAKNYGLSRGTFRFNDNIVSKEAHEQLEKYLESKIDDIRAQALLCSVELQRSVGLRLRESIRITQESIRDALQTNNLHLSKQDGTKNGQERSIPITHTTQKEVLENTLRFMEKNNLHSLIPNSSNQQQQLRFAQNTRTTFQTATNTNYQYHGERKFCLTEIAREFGVKSASEMAGHHREEVIKFYVK